MASVLKVDKLDPQSGTALEIGTSGDTITVPTGAGLTVVDEVKTNKVSPATGTAFALGDSGDTITVPSGATLVVAGTTEITGTNNIQRPNAQPYMINGNFGVWQRGTSFTTSVYTADRWLQDLSGATATVTREAHTVGQTDVPDNPKYYLKQNVTTGNDNCGMLYRIEDVDTLTGAFTLSFYAKGVNPNSGNLDIIIQQNFGSGGSTTVSLSEQDLTLTGSWVKYVFTGTLASISGKTVGTSSYIQIIIKQPNDDSNTAAWNLQISQVQLEAGTYTSSTIPPFQHESYGDNLQRCQRYCYNTNQNNTLYAALSVGAATSTTGVYGELYFPVTMRDNPTGIVVQSTDYWALNSSGGGTDTFDNILVQNCSTTQGTIYCTGNVSQTAGQASRIRNNNTAARLFVVSEL